MILVFDQNNLLLDFFLLDFQKVVSHLAIIQCNLERSQFLLHCVLNLQALFPLMGSGLFAGVLAGFLGIGGGTILVPILISLGNNPVQAVATSSLSIVITAISGSIQNWRMGELDIKNVFTIGFPAILTGQIGVAIANALPEALLLISFGCLLLLNVYLVALRKRVVAAHKDDQSRHGQPRTEAEETRSPLNPITARLVTGGSAGLLAGIFGVGGGVIMVPLQIVWLNESLKRAIQTSLGVIVITAISTTAGHAGLWPWLGNQLKLYQILGQAPWSSTGNVLWLPGIILGLGGLVGVQLSTRLLPKLPDQVITLMFRIMLVSLAIYILWKASFFLF